MEKIKQFLDSDTGKDILTILIIILVGLVSFGLGRLSKESTSSGINIEYKDPKNEVSYTLDELSTANIANLGLSPALSQNMGDKSFFASNRGKKYYPVTCSAGKTIKLENRIYFGTEDQAVKAGYEKSSSCN